MSDNQQLVYELQRLLNRKRSKRYYADKLGVPISKIDELILFIRRGTNLAETEAQTADYIAKLEDTIVKFEEDVINNKAEATYNLDREIKTLDELIERCKINTEIWKIDKYIQNYWGNGEHPHWQVKAFLSKKTPKEEFQEKFMEFLTEFIPAPVHRGDGFQSMSMLPKAALVINKQDQHLNKFDIKGENDIQKRFSNALEKLEIVLKQSTLSNEIESIQYIIGSDEFNSEWTGLTTKGTPQENMATYHESFKLICQYEVDVIDLLYKYCKDVQVTYVSGNHDEYVGWHLVTWLKAFYGGTYSITFDISPAYRKYIKYGESALMFNHGDAIKPAKLSNIFPIEFKDKWSSCSKYYIFTGDKHQEKTMDFNGIKFYQLSAFSKAKSKWDDKNGYIDKGELTVFVIEKEKGITSILKQPL